MNLIKYSGIDHSVQKIGFLLNILRLPKVFTKNKWAANGYKQEKWTTEKFKVKI